MRLFAFLPAALAVYQSICESPAFLLPAIPLSPNISRPHHRMRRSIVVHRELTALFPVALLFYSPPLNLRDTYTYIAYVYERAPLLSLIGSFLRGRAKEPAIYHLPFSLSLEIQRENCANEDRLYRGLIFFDYVTTLPRLHNAIKESREKGRGRWSAIPAINSGHDLRVVGKTRKIFRCWNRCQFLADNPPVSGRAERATVALRRLSRASRRPPVVPGFFVEPP